MDKFTPGPWLFEETTLSICQSIITIEDVQAFQVSPRRDKEHAIAYLPCDVGRAEAEANARLIVAAPELLGALRGVLAAWEHERGHAQVLRDWPEAVAALAKATGE